MNTCGGGFGVSEKLRFAPGQETPSVFQMKFASNDALGLDDVMCALTSRRKSSRTRMRMRSRNIRNRSTQ